MAADKNNVVTLQEARGPRMLRRLAEIDPDIRGFLKLLRDEPELRGKAVQLLEAELRKKKAH